MYFMVSLKSGVGMLGLPMTMRVVHTCAPSCITVSMKSGWLTITCAEPRSRGYQRQRSPEREDRMLAAWYRSFQLGSPRSERGTCQSPSDDGN
jgi:hypothetical protein